tara:strand:+ start:260 stop:937 length:678 start_codon:yes stop_codon:yes gene_type:complete
MSKVYTDNIEKRTGGAAIAVPASGQWIDLASAAQGDVLYHNGTSYVRLAPGTSGQVLTSGGAGANPSWTTTGGLTQASTWRLHTSFTGTGDIVTNLEAVDAPVGFGSLGSAMGETSGIFDFPVTGIWLVKGHFYYWQNGNGGSYYGTGHMNTTTDNSTYAEAAQCRTSDYYSAYGSMTVEYIFDVTDIANCKCKFSVTQGNSAAQVIGDTGVNKTYFTFLKLGDT